MASESRQAEFARLAAPRPFIEQYHFRRQHGPLAQDEIRLAAQRESWEAAIAKRYEDVRAPTHNLVVLEAGFFHLEVDEWLFRKVEIFIQRKHK